MRADIQVSDYKTGEGKGVFTGEGKKKSVTDRNLISKTRKKLKLTMVHVNRTYFNKNDALTRTNPLTSLITLCYTDYLNKS